MIPHNRPTIGEEDIRSVVATLQSLWIAPGARVQEFEMKLAHFLAPGGDAVAVETGTSALHLALLALDIGSGDEVILPTYVCSAVLNAVKYTGALPVLVDINPSDFNTSVEEVRKKTGEKTGAIVIPHMYGIPADIEGLGELGVPVIEDCAQSLGATVEGRKVGTFGDCAIFSFYATKLLTTAKGGAVFSLHRDLVDTIRDLVDFDCRPSYRVRYNHRMSDLQASLGLSQLARLADFIEKRRKIAETYHRVLEGKADVSVVRPGEGKTGVWYRYVIMSRRDPEAIKKQFDEHGITVINPLEPWELLHRYLGLDPGSFPNAERAASRTISIPIYPSLTPPEIARIGDALDTVYGA